MNHEERRMQLDVRAAVDSACASKDRRIAELESVIEEFTDLISHSDGVVGLHLNGDVADWGWLQGSSWLINYATMSKTEDHQ
jgi:hypothetical protein